MGARSLLQPEKKARIVITTGKKKVLVICLNRYRYNDWKKKKIQSSVWRVHDRYYDRKKKKIQSSVWQVRNRYYDRKKKRYSRLSGGCTIIITTGKKKVLVVCLAGAQSLL